MKTLLTAALCTATQVAGGWAQSVPSIGAEGVVGFAGIQAVASEHLLGLPANPAVIAADRLWSAGLGSSAASVTGIAERSLTASARIARFGLAGRITSRWITNLFDDPALQSDPNLRVETAEYAAGVSYRIVGAVRVGYTTFLTTGNVLGSAGSGTGHRIGVASPAWNWLRVGVVYGDAEAPTEWSSAEGASVRERGTKRLSVGASTARLRTLPLEPAVALEWNRNWGSDSDSWIRGSFSLSGLHGALQALGGWAVCVTQTARSYQELGFIADVGRFQLQFGVRLGADPAPGNSSTLGAGVHHR